MSTGARERGSGVGIDGAQAWLEPLCRWSLKPLGTLAASDSVRASSARLPLFRRRNSSAADEEGQPHDNARSRSQSIENGDDETLPEE